MSFLLIFSMLTEICCVALAPIWKTKDFSPAAGFAGSAGALKVPSNNFLPLNSVRSEMPSISSFNALISSWIAVKSSVCCVPVFPA